MSQNSKKPHYSKILEVNLSAYITAASPTVVENFDLHVSASSVIRLT